MSVRVWELQKMKQAKNQFFTRCGFEDNNKRTRELTLLRGAFTCAFRTRATLMEIADVLNRDHSTISHSLKVHDERLMYRDYRNFYKVACNIREEIDMDSLEEIDYKSFESEITRLNDLVAELSKYKELYLTLKKTFDEF
jgi:hypothetical protein